MITEKNRHESRITAQQAENYLCSLSEADLKRLPPNILQLIDEQINPSTEHQMSNDHREAAIGAQMTTSDVNRDEEIIILYHQVKRTLGGK